MKVVFISTMRGWQWGGSEELWSQSAAALKSAGDEVVVCIPDWPKRARKVAELATLGIPIHTHSMGSHRSIIRRVWRKLTYDPKNAPRWFAQCRPDLVVISQGHNSGGFGWARICRDARIPYIVIVHCNSESWWFGDELNDALECYTSARKVFCVSERNLALLRLQLCDPIPDAEIVRNPFNVSCEPAPAWPGSTSGWKIACVARIDAAAKGHDLLLQTLASPIWRDRHVELNLFGSGPDEALLRKMAAALDLKNIRFRGHIPDVRKIWEENHILALPSRFEGLPLALVEAMWCARPAVVTDVGGNTELCVEGKTGFVAPAPTLEFFSSALERAWTMREMWHDMGQAARLLVEGRIPKDPVKAFCSRLRELA